LRFNLFLQNFFNEQKYVEAYFAKDIQKDLALGRSQLVALAMLLGGDYTDGGKYILLTLCQSK
jgi:hypothetical protein